MKKIFLYAIMSAAAAMVACNKVEPNPSPEDVDPEPEVEMITETITASRDASTKATIDNTSGAFAWTATNDQVAVHVNNGTYVTSAGASASEKSATFDVTYPAGATRDAFAVFPSTIVAADAENYGQEGHTLDVTLPASYTLAQVSGETSPCPMIATNDPSSSEWSFKQLCGLLRLTVNGIPSDATGLVIQFPGKKVNGSFSLASPVTPDLSSISLDTPGLWEDRITVTFDAGITFATVNIPLPTGAYDVVYVSPINSSTAVSAYGHIKAGGYTATLAHAKKLTVTLSSLVGKVMGGNGEIYTDAAAASAAGTTAEAMIAYVGRIDGVCDHGLAVSMTDIEAYQMSFAAATGEYAIPVWAAAHPVVGCIWRLPSEKDWQYMIWGYYTDTPVASPVGTVKNVLSNGYYWTLTEIDDDNAKGIYYDGTSNASVQSLVKTAYYHVRACLSF